MMAPTHMTNNFLNIRPVTGSGSMDLACVNSSSENRRSWEPGPPRESWGMYTTQGGSVCTIL